MGSSSPLHPAKRWSLWTQILIPGPTLCGQRGTRSQTIMPSIHLQGTAQGCFPQKGEGGWQAPGAQQTSPLGSACEDRGWKLIGCGRSGIWNWTGLWGSHLLGRSRVSSGTGSTVGSVGRADWQQRLPRQASLGEAQGSDQRRQSHRCL